VALERQAASHPRHPTHARGGYFFRFWVVLAARADRPAALVGDPFNSLSALVASRAAADAAFATEGEATGPRETKRVSDGRPRSNE
jgi:hypothetical protein